MKDSERNYYNAFVSVQDLERRTQLLFRLVQSEQQVLRRLRQRLTDWIVFRLPFLR